MSVKRYEWVACDEHSCHCDVVESAEGDMVDYDDYAALEARCEALAAEVYDLKHPGTYLPSKRETPDLDAFLAEVRASELDSLAGVAETMIVKFANQGASEIPEAKGWEMIHRQASQRAARLRKGAQS